MAFRGLGVMGIGRKLVIGWLLLLAVGRVEAQRLAGGVRPEHYSLVITPDLKAATFAGSETIDVVLDAPSKTITLNAAEIEFVSVRAVVGSQGTVGDKQQQVQQQIPFGNDNKKIADNKKIEAEWLATGAAPEQAALEQVAVVSLDVAKQQATFNFEHELPAGRVRLAIEYKGILNEKLRGFYLSKTKVRRYAVTQFESTDARRAFPSFDEPAMKATFDVALVVDAGDTALSNMRVDSDTPGPGVAKHTIRFVTTPRMSTYLVAWLVGDFKCSSGKADGVAIRACSTPDKVKLTRFALDSAKETLRDYDKYFGIKYPLAKLDLVAIPDFEAGAMENYGCITFRETDLLVDKRDGGLSAKKSVAETVAHEMAHLWFGDLVTPAWWDDLWLNEGFATWMENKEAARLHPKWGFDQDAAVDLDRTMNDDAGRTTRSIRAHVETPAEIEESFDDIAYGKAGAVIAMVENWVGEEKFRKGVQEYLAEHAYANATAEDFWNVQTRVSGMPVDQVMRSFVTQPGVPVVTLGSGGANAPVAQRRFYLSDAAAKKSEAANKKTEVWTIPVCFAREACRLLTPETTTLDVPVTAANHGMGYANAGDKGYYRTDYSAVQLATIVGNAETGLTVAERIGLLGDRWALMREGEGSVGEILDLTLAVKGDANAAVVESALGKIGVIRAEIANDDDRERLDRVVRREFGAVYSAMGKANWHESDERDELRETLFEALGRAGDPAVLADAAHVTEALFAGQKSDDTSMADAAVALTVAQGDSAMYEKLLRVATTSSDPDLKQEALRTLTRFQRPELVERTLELALSDQVRSQDSWMLIALLMARRQTQDAAWVFVQQHWAEVERKTTAGSRARIVEATGSFCTVERRDEVTGFFATHAVKSAERTLAKSIGSIDDCVAMREAQEPRLRQWLDTHAEK